MGLGAFTGARWGAIRVNADVPEGVAAPGAAAGAAVVPGTAGAAHTGDVAPGGAADGGVSGSGGGSADGSGGSLAGGGGDDAPAFRIGIDAGSKTIKIVAIDETGRTVHSLYHRHRSDIQTTLAKALHEFAWMHGDMTAPVSITGSAGIGIAEALGIPFVQEVVATTRAVRERHPQADCIIELGGEDAKIIYLTGGLEQRMNATCAGGTGDFLDGIAGVLNVRSRNFSKLAFGAQRTYPIASRCAVFAQTDVRPLLAAGAAKSDIALSACKAVVKQTIGGLACGRPIRGTVVFLGGPLNYNSALEREFRLALGLTRQTGIRPYGAHLYTAAGAAMVAEDASAMALSELERRVRACTNIADDLERLPPLFDSADERDRFFARHANESVRLAGGAGKYESPAADEGESAQRAAANASSSGTAAASTRPPAGGTAAEDGAEEVFVGVDAGSTTMKYAVVDAQGELVTWDYQHVEGDVLGLARRMLEQVLESVASVQAHGMRRRIAHACVTGYGEDLMSAAFGFDSGVVETAAHLRAAREFHPDVSFVLDIGGQDMKALWVRDGVVVDAVLNEACSSGCGAFVRSNTRALEMSDATFSREAMEARRPIDLGAKCTVFMTSRVRHAQKIGASRGDIAAGVAYSVVNNALTRIIGADRVASMGEAVVVQGGTFKSDAVLRAFEKVTGAKAVRPKEAHLMGAYGAALVARDRWFSEKGASGGESLSSLITLEQLRSLDPKRRSVRCEGCGNSCLLTVVEFGDGRRFVSGNRCERAHEIMFGAPVVHTPKAPNVVALEQQLIGACGNVRSHRMRGSVCIGLMNVLNAYENMPFWHGLFEALGFSIIVPDDVRAAAFADEAAGTVPSESVCHPAKLSHARYADLVHAGADAVFMPRFERGTRCPVASGYADALRDNVDPNLLVSPVIQSLGPRGIMRRREDQLALYEAIAPLAPANAPIDREEFRWALDAALKAQRTFDEKLEAATARALEWLAADGSRRAAVLVGRPYHADPALLHRIDQELNRLGFAVIPPIGLGCLKRKGQRSLPLWSASKHLVGIVELAAAVPRLDVVALRAFGCGYDAIAFDEARDVAERLGRPFTELKIDDIADTAHIRIRLRTLAETTGPAGTAGTMVTTGKTVGRRRGSVTPDLCSTAKALVKHALEAIGDAEPPYSIDVPFICQDCMTDALAFELQHINGYAPAIEVVRYGPGSPGPGSPDNVGPGPTVIRHEGATCTVGLVGNPLLVFDGGENEGIVALLGRLGCNVALPDVRLLQVEDVRYLSQLDEFANAGVDHVVYLQSFGCLKGHVQSRGALHGLARRYPDMPVTVIDYDPESSALNRENRVRLAAEAARARHQRKQAPSN